MRILDDATGVFFTGGDQRRITGVLGGTRCDQLLQSSVDEGELVLAGTSAGAAMMAGTMIVGVFLGARPTAGYEPEIVRVVRDGESLVVEWRERAPSDTGTQAPSAGGKHGYLQPVWAHGSPPVVPDVEQL